MLVSVAMICELSGLSLWPRDQHGVPNRATVDSYSWVAAISYTQCSKVDLVLSIC